MLIMGFNYTLSTWEVIGCSLRAFTQCAVDIYRSSGSSLLTCRTTIGDGVGAGDNFEHMKAVSTCCFVVLYHSFRRFVLEALLIRSFGTAWPCITLDEAGVIARYFKDLLALGTAVLQWPHPISDCHHMDTLGLSRGVLLLAPFLGLSALDEGPGMGSASSCGAHLVTFVGVCPTTFLQKEYDIFADQAQSRYLRTACWGS